MNTAADLKAMASHCIAAKASPIIGEREKYHTLVYRVASTCRLTTADVETRIEGLASGERYFDGWGPSFADFINKANEHHRWRTAGADEAQEEWGRSHFSTFDNLFSDFDKGKF